MKNYLMFALLIGATASMAFGQFGVVVDPAKVDVACPDDECHVAPVFMGEGGFVGELADGFDMANFVVTCDNTTASGTVAEGEGGVVRQVFEMANGLACFHEDGGSIQIHGLADGGWYWINDDMNSAVSPLIAKDALMGDEVMPTDPGGVTLMASDYGTYVKSGDRVGILPHFVPTAPVVTPPVVEPEAAAVCRPVWNTRTSEFDQDTTDCMLGDGGTEIVLRSQTSTGTTVELGNTIYRRTAGDVSVSYNLYGNGTGHLATPPQTGWNIRGGKPFPASFDVLVESPVAADRMEAGVTFTGSRTETVYTNDAIPMTKATATTKATVDWEALETMRAGNHIGDSTGNGEADCIVRTSPDTGAIEHYLFMAADNELGQKYVRVGVDTVTGWNLTAKNMTLAGDEVATLNDTNQEDDVDIATKFVLNADESGGSAFPQVACKTTGKPQSVAGSITIHPSDDLCSDTSSVAVKLAVVAKDAKDMNLTVTPRLFEPVSGSNRGVNASTSLTIMCPSASASSASQGQELVPVAPFPTGN